MRLLKELGVAAVFVVAATLVYGLMCVGFARHPANGKLAVEQYRATHLFLPQLGATEAFAQTAAGMVPPAGTVVTDPVTGHKFRVEPSAMLVGPSGYRPCLPDGRMARAGNMADFRASQPCINGGPVGPGCPEVVSLLCSRNGRQIEVLGPYVNHRTGAITPPTYRDPQTHEQVQP